MQELILIKCVRLICIMFYETNFEPKTNKSNLCTTLVNGIYINCKEKFNRISKSSTLHHKKPFFIFIFVIIEVFYMPLTNQRLKR